MYWKEKAVLGASDATRPGSLDYFPPGVVAIAPEESSLNGKIVANGTLLGFGFLRSKTLIDISNGNIDTIKGGESAEILNELVTHFRNGNKIGEVGLGMNPLALNVGNSEDERVRGSIHIGLGDNQQFHGIITSAIHLDITLRNSSLLVDERALVRNGNFEF